MKRERALPLPLVGLAVVIGVGIGLSGTVAGQGPLADSVRAQSLPPCVDLVADAQGMCEGPLLDLPVCEEEDSDNCVWDARVEGNGIGRSFVAYEGEVWYVNE